MVDDNAQQPVNASTEDENERVEAIDSDADFTLGQFREKTKDLPDSTVILISAIPPSEDEESTADESAENEDEDEEDDSINAPILGVEVEDYTIAGENGDPDKTVRAISIICAIDDLLEDDDEEGDEPVDNS